MQGTEFQIKYNIHEEKRKDIDKESQRTKNGPWNLKNIITKIKCSETKVWCFSHMSITSSLFLQELEFISSPLEHRVHFVTLF